MYYKIENKASEIYQKLHAMRTQELLWEEENKNAITEKTGLQWQEYLGHAGQQTFNRVTDYSGFKFDEPEKVDLRVWKKHPEQSEIFIPNRRTKEGREMDQFIRNGLKGHCFSVVFKNLGIEQPMGRFSFPYIEICDDVIIMFLGPQGESPTDENIIEITSKEFYDRLNEGKVEG